MTNLTYTPTRSIDEWTPPICGCVELGDNELEGCNLMAETRPILPGGEPWTFYNNINLIPQTW